MPANAKPLLSVIVIGYKMARQLGNTLYSLSTQYQRGVSEKDYEVIVVENASDHNFDESALPTLGNNFHFFRRQESSPSPVPAMNFAFGQCRGEVVGLIVDGARMVTPGVLQYVLMAHRMNNQSLTAVPGYQLGHKPQNESALEGYCEEVEQSLLRGIDWRRDGYELFTIASISGANPNGYLQPIMECNCLFAPMRSFARIGFADQRFDLRGGGAINLHMFRSLGLLPESMLVVLPGEGSFHQYHGGVTTSGRADVAAEQQQHRAQLQAIWSNNFHSLRREPLLLGTVSRQAQPYLQLSSEKAQKRFNRFKHQGLSPWIDDKSEIIVDNEANGLL